MTLQQKYNIAVRIMENTCPVTETEKAELLLLYGNKLGLAWIKTLASMRVASIFDAL